MQSRLFERGYRGIQADSGIEGSGLGLAIAQDLLRPYGLSLRVTSPYEGDRGTAFTLTIPLPMKVER